MNFYATLKPKTIDGTKCYISQPFRLYRKEGTVIKSNLRFIRNSLKHYNLPETPQGRFRVPGK